MNHTTLLVATLLAVEKPPEVAALKAKPGVRSLGF
jgi:hypothetical protein